MNKPLKGVGYDLNSTNKGFSFAVHDPAYVEPSDSLLMGLNLPPIPSPDLPYWPIPQFQCFATPGTDEYVGKTILKIVAGGVNYTNSNLPRIAHGVEQNFSQAFIIKAAVLSSGVSAVNGAIPINQVNPYMLNNGFYVIDNPATKHYVVLSYYDGNGPTDTFDIPILTERTPWVSIVAEGSSEFDKLFIEQGPSYYTGLLNIAPMIDYRNAENKIFGFGHTSYFKPIKFGANVKILATIENNLTTQTAHGSQNLTIPLQNHGTRLMYVPGMTELDDPYYSQTDGDFGYVVNKSDITALSSLSYTGGWWDQITNNTNPRSITVNNYSYFSVNYEGTDNMPEFTCSVKGVDLGESFEHRLRIKSGLITFLTVGVTSDYGTINTAWSENNLRITEPNLYPTGTIQTGLNENHDYLLCDGYLTLTEGEDYYVFLYKVTPNWNGYSVCKAPQLVISKVGDSPNTDIQTINNGGGTINQYYVPNGRAMPSSIFGETNTDDEWIWESACLPGTSGDGQLCFDLEGYEAAIETFAFQSGNNSRGFSESACWRKDIAYIKWDAGENKFKVKQLHTGPVIVQDRPIYEGAKAFHDVDDNYDGWGPDGTAPTSAIVNGVFTGYTENLNDGTTNQITSSTTASTYIPNQPSQIENPEIT